MLVEYVNFPTNQAYGVEMELIKQGISQAKIAELIRSIDKKRHVNVSGWTTSANNANWHVKTDSTCGWEIASYKSKGAGDLLNIAKVADVVAEAGGVSDEKCGTHVHAEVMDYTALDVAKIVAYWMKIEDVIQHILPEHRSHNVYCRLLNEYYKGLTNVTFNGSMTPSWFWTAVRPKVFEGVYRRVAFNICNYVSSMSDEWNHQRRTLELRLPEGTLDGIEVKNWVRLFLRFVDFCRKQPFPKDTISVGLFEAMQILGLNGADNRFFLLSQGMHDTKEWFLYRILKYSRQKQLCTDAIIALNKMWSPLKVFELSPNCESFIELI